MEALSSRDFSTKESPVLQLESYTLTNSCHLPGNKTVLFYGAFFSVSFIYSYFPPTYLICG